MALLAVLLLLLLVLLLLLQPLVAQLRPRSAKLPLPPGPWQWPLLGNIVDLFLLQRRLRQPTHAVFAAVARVHGPLVHLRLGHHRLVVASSPGAAAQVLKVRDRELSGRQVPAVYRIPIYAGYSMVWADDSDAHRRLLRALCKREIFSASSLEATAEVRERKAREMVELLLARQGEAVGLGDVVFRTIFNMMANMLFSRDIVPAGDGEQEQEGFWVDPRSTFSGILELGMTPNLEDLYPSVLGGLDPQGLRREVRKHVDKLYEIWDGVIGEKNQQVVPVNDCGGAKKMDVLDRLLAAGCQDLQLKAFLSDMFAAGVDTTTAAVEWTMSELAKHPHVKKKLREELRRAVGSQDEVGGGGATTIRESHIAHLPYLQACIKETLRLHPPAPLLLPHRAVGDCEVMGYRIPAGCTVVVNAWAIGRDAEAWEEPLRFAPERFLGRSVDSGGAADFDLLPFGAGRRSCPGKPVAARLVPLVIASLVHDLEWALPEGARPEQLDMGERLGVVLGRKQPLVLVPRRLFRSGTTVPGLE